MPTHSSAAALVRRFLLQGRSGQPPTTIVVMAGCGRTPNALRISKALKWGTALLLAFATGDADAQDRTVDVRVLPNGAGSPAVGDTVTYTNLMDALRNGQLDFARRRGVDTPASVDALISAFTTLLAGDRSIAAARFDSLRTSSDRGVASLATQANIQLLLDHGRWAALRSAIAAVGGDSSVLVNALERLRIVPSWSTAPARSTVAQQTPRGHVLLEARVNDRAELLMFDTGASMTVLTASTAARHGVLLTEFSSGPLSTSTSITREGRIGILDELHLGELVVRQLPVLVFRDEDLTFNTAQGGTETVHGIIGWDVIRQARTRIDLVVGRYSSEPSPGNTPSSTSPADTLFWLGYPIVRVHGAGGQPLLFGLDTGSRNTSLTPNLFRKVAVGARTRDTISIRGLGGAVVSPVEIAERVVLNLTGRTLELRGAWTEEHGGADEVFFLQIDGVLGMDIAAACVMEVDPPRARFGLVCPSV